MCVVWVSWWTLGKRLILCFLQIYDFFVICNSELCISYVVLKIYEFMMCFWSSFFFLSRVLSVIWAAWWDYMCCLGSVWLANILVRFVVDCKIWAWVCLCSQFSTSFVSIFIFVFLLLIYQLCWMHLVG